MCTFVTDNQLGTVLERNLVLYDRTGPRSFWDNHPVLESRLVILFRLWVFPLSRTFRYYPGALVCSDLLPAHTHE